MPLIRRLFRKDHAVLRFTLDGLPCEGCDGDTLLTAILGCREALRISEFLEEPRAGFCQMGACQDCWMSLESGERVRACTTPLRAGLRVVTRRGRAP